MTRRIAPFFLLVALLTLLLSACGDTKPKEDLAPTYEGAASVELPDSFKNQLDASLKNVLGKKFDAYKTSDSTAKVQSFFSDTFQKNGWTNSSSKLSASTSSLSTSLQSPALLFHKNEKSISVLIMPGTQATKLGIKDLAPTDTFYLVIEGEH
jgi:hypothetical protein